MKTLREIFDKNKCDKGSSKHRYDRVYEPTLNHLRDKKFNMLEIGILRGESIRAWLEFFPHVTFYCIDIFTQIPPESIEILKNPRVKWCVCDSIEGPNDAFKKMTKDILFDVIIDDGLHRPEAQQNTFENFITYMKGEGTYFIEDLWPLHDMSKEELKNPWIINKSQHYTMEKHTNLLKSIEKYDMIFHDLRDEYEPDTYLIEINNKK